MADNVQVSQQIVELGYMEDDMVQMSQQIVELGYRIVEGRTYGPPVQCNC